MVNQFAFRRMQPSDKDDVLRICSKIWEGRDFIPSKFDEWVNDEKGYFVALLSDDKLVGMSRITYITDTDVLLEGLRKDPDSNVKGVCKAVTEHFLEMLHMKKELTSIRFVTNFKNAHVRNVSEKLGFRLIHTFSHKRIPTYNENNLQSASFAPVTQTSDIEKILDYVHKSDFIPLSKNLLMLRWLIYQYSDEAFIEKLIKPGLCRGIIYDGEIKALAATWIERGIHLPFFDAENFTYAKSLIIDLLASFQNEKEWAMWILLPEIPRLKSYFADMGFMSRESENDCLIYEYPVDW